MTENVRHGVRVRNESPYARAGNENSSSLVMVSRHEAAGELSGPGASLDHFVERDGLRFAGTHLILDLWDASNLDDLGAVERTLRRAAQEAGATLLRIDLHGFAPTGGITGVAVLAESHISIHTWPERAYAAVDVFMCGDAKPHKSVEVIREAFQPATVTLLEHKRGLTP
jgi:S-adenosylmethionine decarboxylase